MTAQIQLQLQGAQEVLAQLRQIQATLRATGGGGAVPGVQQPLTTLPIGSGPSTGLGQGTSGPPPPMAPPVSLATQVAGTAAAPATVAAGPNVSAQLAQMASAPGGPQWTSSYATWIQGRGTIPLALDPLNGRYMNPLTGEYMLGAGSGKDGPPDQKNTLFQALGGMAAVHSAANIMTSAMGGYSSAAHAGRTFRPESLLPAAGALAFTTAGAAIGSVVPGLGTGIGAGIGAIVGGMYSAAVGPAIERNTDRQRLIEEILGREWKRDYSKGWMAPFGAIGMYSMIRGLTGMDVNDADWNTSMIATYSDLAARGHILPESWGDTFNAAGPTYGPALLGAAARGRYRPGNLRKYGMGRFEGGSAQELLDSLMAESYDDPGVAAGLRRLAKKASGKTAMRAQLGSVLAEDNYLSSQLLRDDMAGSAAESSAALSLAARYGGSAAMGPAIEARAGYTAQMRERAKELDAQALPGQARAVRAQAGLTDIETRETYFGVRASEISAAGGLAMGEARRALDRDLYGGKRYDQMDFDRSSRAASTHAGALSALMEERRKAGMLSPAEEMQLTEQIQGLRHQAEFEIPRQREGIRNSTLLAESSLRGASTLAAGAQAHTFGSMQEQASVYDAQLTTLQDQAATLKEILETSRYLSHEQKAQLQTQMKQLEVETTRTRAAGAVAKADADRGLAFSDVTQASYKPSLALIEGAGGMAAFGASKQLHEGTKARVGAQRQYIGRLLAEGFSEDSREVRAARDQLVQMELGAAREQQDRANVPLGGFAQAELSTLQAQTTIMKMGYGGTQGGIRGNLLKMIGVLGQHAGQINEAEAALRAEQGGKLTGAQAAQFAQQRANYALQAAGLQQEYDEGFDQRLISAAYNMPAAGRLHMSRFTRRESAFAGVYNRLFGGTKAQTERMRAEGAARIRDLLGTGHPVGFEEQAMAMGGGYVGNNGGPIRLEGKVDVTVRDQSGTVIGQSEGWVRAAQQWEQLYNLPNSQGKSGGF